ncbi:phosphoethanolamine transferase [Pseudoalteromonas rhizosphaerae]|uniref:phosphoethanolamine transferase n=1 Tax=Pseudoalteromonas rhizosphaerae TaxID=2518973 RepID=UPI00384F215F
MQQFKHTLLTLLALWAFALMPDVIYGLFNHNYLAGYNFKSIIITLLLMVFLLLSRTPKLNNIVLLIMALMQASELMYFQYFGGFYSAFDMVLMMGEMHDALIGFADGLKFMLPAFFLSMAFYGLAYFTYNKYHKTSFTVPYISVFFVLLLTLPFLQSLGSKSSQKYQPNIAHSAMKNGLYSVSFFSARQLKMILGLRKEMPSYQPYQLSKGEPADANIVILMGESLSYYNMGLYGYQRDTTPDLMPYKQDPNFFYLPAISSAVSTRVSLSLFFNTVYEPNNAVHISKMDTALFRLAKRQGFETHYITTQKNAGGLTYAFSLGDIDTWKEDKHLDQFDGDYDDRLLLELNSMNLDYNKPQFITLHMRSAHAPYVANYPKTQEVYPVDEQPYEKYMLNSYDNSVLYTQKVIANIYEFFKDSGKPTYIFFTPDHGELTGQDGRFGHNAVDMDIARVPFMFYGVDIPKNEITRIKKELGCMPNHYLISLQVAKVLGYDIKNPNEEQGKYYLNGTDVFGEAGFMQYDLKQIQDKTCPEFSK